MKRIASIVLSVAMAALLLAGCRQDVDGGGDGGVGNLGGGNLASEYTFIAETVSLPYDIGVVRSLSYGGGKIYFAATTWYEEGDITFRNAQIYSMNLDGTGLAALAEYVPTASEEIPEGALSFQFIDKLAADSEGGLWTVEEHIISTWDLPANFDEETDELKPEYYKILDIRYDIRKLDASGAELHSFDISGIAMTANNEPLSIYAFSVIGDDILLSVGNINNQGNAMYILDDSGNVQAKLDTDAYIERFIHLPDGRAAFQSGGGGLQTINISAKALGETIAIPGNGGSHRTFYSGCVGTDILLSDGIGVYGYTLGYTLGEAEAYDMLQWNEINAIINNVEDIVMVSDETIVCLNVDYNSMPRSFEIIILDRTLRSELPEMTFLTLGGINISSELRNAVSVFNVTHHPHYTIEIVDYMQYNDNPSDPNDWSGAIAQFALDVTTGNAPDLVQTISLPYVQYAESGLFADLYEFIDADPTLARGDLVQAFLRAYEYDGGLYQIAPLFHIDTFVAAPSVVGEGIGWTVDEFMDVMGSNPGADIPLGDYITKTGFLSQTLWTGLYDYIDRETGEVYFDSPDFIRLLEFANSLPDNAAFGDYSEAVAEGRQLAIGTVFNDFYFIQYYKSLFGGNVALKSYPSAGRHGGAIYSYRSVSIMQNSQNKEAAWEFARTFLDKEWQLKNVALAFPTNQAAFDELVRRALETDVDGLMYSDTMPPGFGSEIDFPVSNPTQDDIDMMLDLINSSAGWVVNRREQAPFSIILEDASNYFNGIGSAQDAARIIQNRVSLWMSERG